MPLVKMLVYIAGPVRSFRSRPGTFEAMRRAVERFGHEVVHEDAPAGGGPALGGARGAFERDFDALSRADLLLAEVSDPSHGVGWKVSWVLAKGRLVVLCAHRDAATNLSPMLVGNPSPWQRLLVYADDEDLARQLDSLLS